MRLSRLWPALLCFSLFPCTVLTLAPGRALADEDEPAEKPADKPGTKPGPVTYDKISQDWLKNVKKNGSAQYARERAEYWVGKGATGKDLYWLGKMWEKAGEHAKAIPCFEAYLKVEGADDKNREGALAAIMDIHVKAEDWPQATAAAENLLKTYPGSKNAPGFQGTLGRIQRQAGNEEKAIEYFTLSAAGLFSPSVLDLVDIHMLHGEIDKAIAVCDKALEGLQKAGVKDVVSDLRAFLGKVGTAAPSPADAVLLTDGEKPASWGPKWTLLFYTPVLMQGLERNLRDLASIKRAWGEVLDAYGVMSYMQYNPFTRKEEPDLTPEKEAEHLKKVVGKESGGSQVLLFTKPATVGLGLSGMGAKVLLDPEGKLKWVRITHQSPYDWWCVEQALKRFAPPSDAK